MTRFERKNRTDISYKGCGGITDALDDMIKQLWRINDDEYDYLCDNLTDEELCTIIPEFKSISQIKEAINITNKYLSNYEIN
jgi:hypothetical protein